MNYFPIKDLKRAEYNPRKISHEEMEALMLSIETHGFCEPITVNIAKDRYGTIIGGHQRITAVEKILAKVNLKEVNQPTGIIGNLDTGQWEIPCFTVELDLESEKLLNIALNRIHGKFDESKLFDIIAELHESPIITSTGLSAAEIASVLDRDSGVKHVDINTDICVRCNELKLNVQAHARRTGHPLWLKDDNEKK